ALVQPVPGDGIDEPGGVADEQGALARDERAAPAERQRVAARALDRLVRDAAGRTDAAEVGLQPRPLARPRADADVDVVGLREHPAVAAGDRAELEERAAAEAGAESAVGDVALIGDAAQDPVAEPERAGGGAVRAVGADDRVHRERRAPRADEAAARLDPHGLALPHLDARLPRGVEQERVQAAA